jgi:bacterioferritin
VLTGELTAINQYFVDAKMFDNWGLSRLGKRFYDESIGEMKDADRLIERILYLDGTPNLQRLGTVKVGESPREKLDAALELERVAIGLLNTGIGTCSDRGDHGTRELLEDILQGEEDHADWLETQIAAIDQTGLELYLAQQIND